MNPLNDPTIIYIRSWLGVRLDAMRDENGRSAGASAIEWAIITGLLATVAFVAFVAIQAIVEGAAQDAQDRVNGPAGGGGGGE
jgi:hypothetical protein